MTLRKDDERRIFVQKEISILNQSEIKEIDAESEAQNTISSAEAAKKFSLPSGLGGSVNSTPGSSWRLSL